MRIVVIAVGKLRDRAVAELTQKYEKRLAPGVKIEWIEVSMASGRGEPKQALAKEAERIRKRLPERAYVVALSEKGEGMDSVAFARWLGRLRDQGRDVCFIVGSASGLHPSLLEAADKALSLSKLTFPHELVRAMLAEQVYRAFSILGNEPYHK